MQMAAILDSGTEIELTTYRDVFGLQNTTIVNILTNLSKEINVQITRVMCFGRPFLFGGHIGFWDKKLLGP